MAHPAMPPINVNIRTGLTGCSKASSISCRGIGEYTVKSVWPAPRKRPIASTVASKCPNTASTPGVGGGWKIAVNGFTSFTRPHLAALRSRQHFLHLRDRDRREGLHEQEEPHEEPPEAPGHDPPIGPGRVVRGVREALERLEPHADVHEDRHDEQSEDVGPDLVGPQEPRQEPVADVHRPARPPERPERAIQ